MPLVGDTDYSSNIHVGMWTKDERLVSKLPEGATIVNPKYGAQVTPRGGVQSTTYGASSGSGRPYPVEYTAAHRCVINAVDNSTQ